MMDDSYLDTKYFIDEHVFNCPFCNRNNVNYYLEWRQEFNWTKKKKCIVYFTICSSCKNKSMHLSHEVLNMHRSFSTSGNTYYTFSNGNDLDSKFFYSVPTSFFSLDSRIPSELRELITEAEGCLKGNYLTGASACARKIIYELSAKEGAEGENYEERIKSLKKKRTDVEGEYFDTLLTIQQVTSDKVHEESYDGWKAGELKLMLSTITEILAMMYVIPEIRKEKRQAIVDLKDKILGASNNNTST